MRLQFQKMKSNPFSTLKERKNKNHNKSQEYEMVGTLGQVESNQIQDPPLKNKYRHKSFGKNKDTVFKVSTPQNYSFKDLGRQLQDKKTLVEQNQQLKKKIESMVYNKSNRKGSGTKKLVNQFEKQLYWNGNQSYMISGVKLQYQKMKDNYLKKSEEYEQLVRSAVVSNNMQFITYIEALEVENHILSRQSELLNTKNYNIQDQKILINNLNERILQYELMIDNYKNKNKNKSNQIKKLNNKIKFLQKLIINKDNNEHAINKKYKRIQNQKNNLLQKIKLLQQQINNNKKQYQIKIDNINKKYQQTISLEINQQIQNQKEQNNIIIRLQRENRYLQGLIDSWKAEKLPQKHHRQSRQSKDNHNLDHMHHSHYLHKDEHNSKQKGDSEHLVRQSQVFNHHTPHKPKQFDKRHQHQVHVEDQTQSVQHEITRVVPFTADTKNSSHSIKNRRVQPYEIQQIIQFSRLKFIAQELDVDWVVKQFQGYEDDDKWSKEYISMGQARDIFQKKFCMPAQESLLLARYLIEHSNQEYVYTDDLNEHPRAIVKSILRTVYGNYAIYTNNKKQFEQIIQDYRNKLQLMLESTTKGGVVNKQKFIEIIQSLSINCQSGFDIYCIAKMAIHSQSVQKLKFKFLFNSQSKND